MRQVTSTEKHVVCNFVNELCGSDVKDVSVAADQCECLVGAVIVCLHFKYNSNYSGICLCFIIFFCIL